MNWSHFFEVLVYVIIIPGGYVIIAKQINKSLDKRMETLEMLVVRQVMEEDTALAKTIISTYQILTQTMNSGEALKQARRLHGLPP